MSDLHTAQTGSAPARAPGRFLKISDVVRETSLSRATIYRLIGRDKFPAPTRVALQRVAWPEHAIEAWKNEQLGVASS